MLKKYQYHIDTEMMWWYYIINPIQGSSQTSEKMGLKSTTDTDMVSVSNEKARLIL